VPGFSPARPVDVPGQVLVVAMLSALTFGAIEGSSLGWGSLPIVGSSLLASAAFVALLAVERGRLAPLLELRFFRRPPFSGANAVAVASFLVLSEFLFVNVLYLQEVRGGSAFVAGMSLLPATTVIAAFSLLAGRLVARFGAGSKAQMARISP